MTKGYDYLGKLPHGFKWYYPKKGEYIHGLTGRHVYNGEVALSVRQVHEIGRGEKSYEEALATALGGERFKSSFTHPRVSYYRRYRFTSEAEANLFARNLPQDPSKKAFMQAYGPVVDPYEPDDTGNRWLRWSNEFKSGAYNANKAGIQGSINTYRKNFIGGNADIFEVVVYRSEK